MSMKRLLVLVALATVIAAPAFAQHEPSSDHRTRSSSHRELDTYYYERNGNTNRDFQLGGSRWKTVHHRARPSSRSARKK
jgi:Ni/Co efflux regulator RcnB